MTTPIRSKHAWAWKVVAIAGVASMALAAATPAPGVVTLKIATTDGVPGGKVTLTMSMSRAPGDACPNGDSDCTTPGEVCVNGFCEPAIASAQTDVIFNTAQLGMSGFCSVPPDASVVCETGQDCVPTEENFCEDLPCQMDARLTDQSFTASLPPFQNLPPGQRRLRLFTGATTYPPPTFSDGVLATCEFDVATDASPGLISLVPDRPKVGDQLGNVVTSTVEIDPGSILSVTPTVTGTPPTATPTVTGTPPTATVTGTPPTPTETGTPPTPTVTGTPPTPTETGTPATPTETGTPPTPTVTGTPPTATVTGTPPTPTATGSPTEIPCVGDCGDDEKVTQADLVIGVGIDLQTTPYEECPQFDRDHSGTVTVDEVVTGIVNFALPQCPAAAGG